VPTGVAIRDVREQLFAAAERILLRDGPNALTSRAVTTEAGVAKGVLHRHFADFDAFLADLIMDRIERIEREAAWLRDAAGIGSVVNNVTGALLDLFSSAALRIIALVAARDELRARVREARQRRQPPAGGVPLLAEGVAMIAGYLDLERQHGRIAEQADTGFLALTLIGSVHLLLAGQETALVDEEAVHRIVTSALSGAARG
jgi:AcrR family transcriptional regulator